MKLLLLPGLDGTGILFSPILDRLSCDWTVEVISYPIDGPQDFETLEHHVLSLLPRNEDFILVAESFSGPVAYQLAQRNNPRLKEVVFVATFLEAPRPMLLQLVRLLFGIVGRFRPPSFILRQFLLGRSAPTATLDLFRQAVRAVPRRVMAARMKSVLELGPPTGSLNIHCAYIQARGDRLVPATCVEQFKRNIPFLRTYLIEGPHFVMQSNVDGCVDVLRVELGLLTTALE